MKYILLSLLFFITSSLIAQNYTAYFTGSTTDSIAEPLGGICMMGGASESDEAMIWFLEQANGGDILVLRASGSDGYNDYMYTDLGVTVNSVETIVFNDATASDEIYIQDKIQKAEAIWFAGGDQWDYISYWRDTKIDSLINDGLENRNIVIGGTSAGMAILGGAYFSAENGTITSAAALANPYDTDCTVDSAAFLYLPNLSEVITDTHYDDPDRKGRHVTFLAKAMIDFNMDSKGIACDEYTAVCIGSDNLAHVYGGYPTYDDFAYFLVSNCEVLSNTPEVCTAGSPLTWDQDNAAVRVYKVPGTTSGSNTFNIGSWYEGSGGEWELWSVEAGVLTEMPDAAPECLLSTENYSQPTLLYPNPTSGIVYLQFQGIKTMRIYDYTGNTVYEGNDPIVDLTHLSNGIYFINYEDENGTLKSEKLILKK